MKQFFSLPGIGDIPVKRTRTIRRLAVIITPEKGIRINVPPAVPDRMAEVFLQENRDALLRHLKKLQIKREAPLPWEAEGAIRTHYHLLRVHNSGDAPFFWSQDGKEVTIGLPQAWSRQEKIDRVNRWLATIYRQQGEKYLPERVCQLAAAYGFSYRQITLRNNRSRWGSCSFSDNISLNVQLMQLPFELIDYVILHELCHTQEKNHSARFWALMDRVCPTWRNDRKALRAYSTRLM